MKRQEWRQRKKRTNRKLPVTLAVTALLGSSLLPASGVIAEGLTDTSSESKTELIQSEEIQLEKQLDPPYIPLKASLEEPTRSTENVTESSTEGSMGASSDESVPSGTEVSSIEDTEESSSEEENFYATLEEVEMLRGIVDFDDALIETDYTPESWKQANGSWGRPYVSYARDILGDPNHEYDVYTPSDIQTNYNVGFKNLLVKADPTEDKFITSFKLNTTSITVKEDQEVLLSVSDILPADASNKEFTFLFKEGSTGQATFGSDPGNDTSVYIKGFVSLGTPEYLEVKPVKGNAPAQVVTINVVKDDDPIKPNKLDISSLEAAIKTAESKEESKFTVKSWQAANFKEVLPVAKDVLTKAKDQNAKTKAAITQADVDAQTKAVNDAVAKLVLKTDDGKDDGNGGKDNGKDDDKGNGGEKGSDTGNNNQDKRLADTNNKSNNQEDKNRNGLPQTGESKFIITSLIGLEIVLICGVVCLVRKRKASV